MPYYPIGNGTIITPQWFNDIQNRLYNSDSGEYKQWLDSDLSDNAGQIKSRLANLTDEFKVTGMTGLYANINGGKAKDTLGNLITIPDSTVLCTDNTINYICLDKNGSINSYSSIQGMVLAKVTLSSGVLVSNEDMRARWLLFDVNDIHQQVSLKNNSFSASKNYTYFITPTQNITISLPVSNEIGDSLWFVIVSSQYSVSLQNNNIKINSQLEVVDLFPNNIYQLRFISDTIGWYCAISPLNGTMQSTQLTDMPSTLVPNKILQVNQTGDRYLLSDYPVNRWKLVNANYTALNNDRIFADTYLASFFIDLPASPQIGDYIEIFGNFATNNLTVNRNGLTIDNATQNITLSTDKQVCRFFYTGTTWVSSAGTATAESSGIAISGVLGVSSSIYTSSLLNTAVQGSGALLDETSKLCLIAYSASDNKFYIRPAVLNDNDTFSFYPSITFTDAVREVKILRVSNTQAFVIYYIPSSNQIIIRLISIANNRATSISQENILGAIPSYGVSWALPALPGNYILSAFQAVYDNNVLVVTTGGDSYFYTINNNEIVLSFIINKTVNNFTQPTTIIRNNNYWYLHYIHYYGYHQANNIGTSSNEGMMQVVNQSTQSLVFQEFSGAVLHYFDSWHSQYIPSPSPSGAIGCMSNNVFGILKMSNGGSAITPTTSAPFYSLTNNTVSNSYLPAGISNTIRPYFITQIGNKLLTLSNTITWSQTQNITNGVLATSPSANLLSLSTPSVTHSFYGRLTDNKACIVTNGIIAVVYI